MFKIDSYDFKGKRAIIRVDFNVPLNEKGEVTDDTRIRAAIPTIKKVLAEGGSVILMSHMGRPKKNPDPKYSLEQIVPAVEKNLGTKVEFAGDCIGEKAAEMAKNLKPGQVMLLENLRFYAEEEGKPRGLAEDASEEEKAAAKKAVKASQKEFVERLASYADCYINDAFGTAHRAHASTALIADKFPHDKMFGYVMENELQAVDRLMLNPRRPFAAIIGGSKVSTKISILENLMEKVDSIVIGGGITAARKWIMPSLLNELRSKMHQLNGNELNRVQMKVYDLDDETEFREFAKGAQRPLKVYGTDRYVAYDPQKRIGVTISKLGASQAISVGAYAFALSQLDTENA